MDALAADWHVTVNQYALILFLLLVFLCYKVTLFFMIIYYTRIINKLS